MGAKMPHKRLKQRLVDAWGKMPDAHYFAGDMELIRLYADYRGKTGRDGFLLDDNAGSGFDDSDRSHGTVSTEDLRHTDFLA